MFEDVNAPSVCNNHQFSFTPLSRYTQRQLGLLYWDLNCRHNSRAQAATWTLNCRSIARSVTASEFKKRATELSASTLQYSDPYYLETAWTDSSIHDLTKWHKLGWLNPRMDKRSLQSLRQLPCQASYTVTHGTESRCDEIPASLLLPG